MTANRQQKMRLKQAAAFCGLAVLVYWAAVHLFTALAGAMLSVRVPGASMQNPAGASQTEAALLHLLVSALALACPFLLLFLPSQGKAVMLLFRRPVPGTGKALFLLFWIMMMLGDGTAGLVARWVPSSGSRVELAADFGLVVLAWFAVALVPAVGEELLFRGLIQGYLRPCGSWLSVVGQAVLFSLLHGTVPACISALFGGLALGLCAEYSKSLVWGILFHLYNNTMAIAAQYNLQYGSGLFIQLILQWGLPLVMLLWCIKDRKREPRRPKLHGGLCAAELLRTPAWMFCVLVLLGNVVYTTLR